MILYTQKSCPQCAMIHGLMDKKKIPYEEISDVDIAISNGITSTPSLDVDGKILKGKDLITFIKNYTGGNNNG